MDDFIKDLTNGEPYQGPYKASKMFKITAEAILESLSPVFHQMKKAAAEGYVDIKDELDDPQRELLEQYGYDVIEFDEDDEEYTQGFKYQIQWADANEEVED